MFILPFAMQAAASAAPIRPVAAYLGCVRREAQQRSALPAPTRQLDAVMAACEPLAGAAASDYAITVQNDAAVINAQAAYIQKHGTAPDIVAASYRFLHATARGGATQILSGTKGLVTVNSTFSFDDEATGSAK